MIPSLWTFISTSGRERSYREHVALESFAYDSAFTISPECNQEEQPRCQTCSRITAAVSVSIPAPVFPDAVQAMAISVAGVSPTRGADARH